MHPIWNASHWAVAILLLCYGCKGEIAGSPTGPGSEATSGPASNGGAGPGGSGPTISVEDLENLDCSGLHAGAAPLLRLTPFEYDNTVRDLLGDGSRPASRLMPTVSTPSSGMEAVTALVAEQYLAAAEEVAARVTEAPALEGLLGCPPDGQGEDACMRGFVRTLLPRAYRRPVSADEETAVMSLFETVRSELGYREAVRAALETVLQSPSFLYRVELSDTSTAEAVALDSYQIAARLSYLVWGSMPDAELFQAAKDDRLQMRGPVEAQARRLLADARSAPRLESFFSSYLSLSQVLDTEKDPAVYPAFSPKIAALMQQETHAFVREVLTRDDGSFRTLMLAPWSMMNQELAAYYGVPGPAGASFERVNRDANHHAGLLTQGALLAARARPYETSPIHRGIFLRDQIMCGTVPDVPEGLDTTPPDPDPNLTTRERLAEHRADPVCGSCHEQLDPLGFAFEHIDGAGRFRADENGRPIDSSGVVVASDLSDDAQAKVPFDGIVNLARQLVDSPAVQLCFSKHWFRFAYGRVETTQDACALRHAFTTFKDKALDVRELLVALTQTDAFFYRAPDVNN